MIVIEKKKILLPLDHGTRQYHNTYNTIQKYITWALQFKRGLQPEKELKTKNIEVMDWYFFRNP